MPDSNSPNEYSKEKGKHPLDYFIAAFLVLTSTATAACYTRQQWLTMQDAEIRQLRAYIFPTDGVVADKPIIGALVFKNSGQTPAYNFEIRMYITAAPYLLRGDLPRQDLTGVRVVLGPGIQYAINTPMARALNAEEVSPIKKGAAAIYVYGDIDFTDAFEIHRCVKFRYYFGGDKGTQSPSGPLNTYRNGNEEGC